MGILSYTVWKCWHLQQICPQSRIFMIFLEIIILYELVCIYIFSWNKFKIYFFLLIPDEFSSKIWQKKWFHIFRHLNFVIFTQFFKLSKSHYKISFLNLLSIKSSQISSSHWLYSKFKYFLGIPWISFAILRTPIKNVFQKPIRDKIHN